MAEPVKKKASKAETLHKQYKKMAQKKKGAKMQKASQKYHKKARAEMSQFTGKSALPFWLQERGIKSKIKSAFGHTSRKRRGGGGGK